MERYMLIDSKRNTYGRSMSDGYSGESELTEMTMGG